MRESTKVMIKLKGLIELDMATKETEIHHKGRTNNLMKSNNNTYRWE